MKLRNVLTPALAVVLLALPAWADLSKREQAELKQQIGVAAKEGRWDAVGAHLTKLAEVNDTKTFKFMLKVVEAAPERYELHDVLRDAAAKMDGRGVDKEVKKAALKSKAPGVRRALLVHLAAQGDWETLIEAIADKDEQVAALAAWKLIDAKVETAVEPMISQMEKLEQGKDGIWDVLRNGLGRLFGGRSELAVEYRSRWEMLKAKGGLSAVDPGRDAVEERAGAVDGELRSGVRLFGREIDCTRVVFILDVSGSMETIDPNQKDYDDDGGSRVRPGSGQSGVPEKPPGKTRLERAQIQLKRVIKNLPGNYKINIVAYSSRCKIWRAHDGDTPPQLHPLTDATRADAMDFVDRFRADGVTATDMALQRAFDVEGLRCIYLLSDGMATHDGTTKIPTDELLSLLASYKDRHVTVHTLGFPEADEEMMRALADATGGKYSDIK